MPSDDDYLGQLTAVQAVVLERAEHQHLLRSLRLVLDGDLDTAELAERVTAAVGTSLRADRCTILTTTDPAADRHWTRTGADLPPPLSYAGASAPLRRLLDRSARDRRRAGPGADEAVVVVPLVARDDLVGWLVVERGSAGPWQPMQLEVLDEHAPDVAMALLLARVTADLRSIARG